MSTIPVTSASERPDAGAPRVLTSPPRARGRALPRRSGGIYVAVLGVALIIALVSMASLHLSRAEIEVLTGAEQTAAAELLAQSAVEFAVAYINGDPNWRSNNPSGYDLPTGSWVPFGAGGVKFVLSDPDGNLNDDSRDAVTVRGMGRVGEAVQVVTATLEPTTGPLNSLSRAMVALGNVTLTGATITTDRTVCSNGSISVTTGLIEGDAQAGGTISGTVSGTSTPGSGGFSLPNDEELWHYYLANGTRISIASIPSQTIDRVVLSANSNPYGVKNPQGIYIIDTGGQTLHIRDSRIVGTLVVISPAAATEVESLINWTSPGPNFPALLVNGSLKLEWSGGSSLVESTAGVNFNPVGTPYETLEDADQADSYPGIIRGLVYCSGDLTVTSPAVMKGVLLAAGTANVSSALTIAYDARPNAFPPPGFALASPMRVIPRTWKRVAQ
jgi:hypothetical protein